MSLVATVQCNILGEKLSIHPSAVSVATFGMLITQSRLYQSKQGLLEVKAASLKITEFILTSHK